MNTNESYFLPLIQIPGQEDTLELEEPPNEIPSNYHYNYTNPKLSFMDSLYIGSLTVVGLFIVFRFVQRSH
jgi:hypothetical protein